MKDIIKKTITGVITGFVTLSLLFGLVPDKVQPDLSGGPSPFTVQSYKSANASTTTYTVGPQEDTEIMATTTNRCWANISNFDARDLYISFTASTTAATVGDGLYIVASSTYEFDTDNRYIGPVQAIKPIATSTISVTEFICK